MDKMQRIKNTKENPISDFIGILVAIGSIFVVMSILSPVFFTREETL